MKSCRQFTVKKIHNDKNTIGTRIFGLSLHISDPYKQSSQYHHLKILPANTLLNNYLHEFVLLVLMSSLLWERCCFIHENCIHVKPLFFVNRVASVIFISIIFIIIGYSCHTLPLFLSQSNLTLPNLTQPYLTFSLQEIAINWYPWKKT